MAADEKRENTSPWQKFYDNIWLLLILGFAIPSVIYTVWGVIEIFFLVPQLPIAK
ncbi:MAG TPA: hypothetical protein VFF54_06400 [Thermodesulfobacteriota bacterium]|nr:hypothetical protein [Thermodesulfobacteriota bacterium]